MAVHFSDHARLRLICVTALLCAPALFIAQAADSAAEHHADHTGPHFTLAEALQRAEKQHPLFASWRERERAAQARRDQAGLRPPPEIGLSVENVFGSGRLSGLEAAETTLGFSQLIERGGLRDRRVGVADAERALLLDEGEIARLDLRAEIARRFVHVLADQAQLGITREATRLVQDTLAEVERRVQAARAPLAERARAQVSLERARLEEEHAEHELLSSRRHLAAAIGEVDATFGAAEGDLLSLPPVADFEALAARMRVMPDALRFASQARVRESELRLAQSRRMRPLSLGAGIRHLETADDLGLVFEASLPLFGAARAQGEVAEAEARLAQIAPDREHAWLKAQAQLYEVFQELNHARVEVEAQRERVVPTVEEALRLTRIAYERGRYSLLELREAQTEWAAQRRRLIQAAAEFHGHQIEIQRLSGAAAPAIAPTESSQP